MSIEASDGLWECLEDFEPAELFAPLFVPPGNNDPSSNILDSADRSLCSLRPKNDFPPEDWRDLGSIGGFEEGISVTSGLSQLRD